MPSQSAAHLERVDRAIAEIDAGTKRALTPPSYGESHRSAITSCVDGIVTHLSDRIGQLRKALDRIEQHALQSAARSKGMLEDHISTAQRLDEQVSHVETVIGDLEFSIHGSTPN